MYTKNYLIIKPTKVSTSDIGKIFYFTYNKKYLLCLNQIAVIFPKSALTSKKKTTNLKHPARW